jgi:hypothetical protein
MKPSEIKPGLEAFGTTARKPKFPVDEKADPPITMEEALAANAGLCPWHPGSLMGQRGDREGIVYLCLHSSCMMYRRYEKHRGPSRAPLAYPVRGYG